MQNPNKLAEYLNGNLSYMETVSIFSMVCTQRSLIKTLLKGESTRNVQHLEYHLKKYLKQNKVDWNQPTSPPPTTTTPPTSTIQKESIAQPLGNVFEEGLKEMYRERGHLHGRLHEVTTDEARYKLMQQLDAIQKKIDKILKGSAPAEDEKKANALAMSNVSAADFKRARNLKQYIQRAKKQLEENPANTTKLNAKIAEWQSELNQITWEK